MLRDSLAVRPLAVPSAPKASASTEACRGAFEHVRSGQGLAAAAVLDTTTGLW
jgi:hypothetical protein